MDGLHHLSTRPLQSATTAPRNGLVERATDEADTLRQAAGKFAQVSWRYDEVLRDLRRAATLDEKAAAMRQLRYCRAQLPQVLATMILQLSEVGECVSH